VPAVVVMVWAPAELAPNRAQHRQMRSGRDKVEIITSWERRVYSKLK
jgi:hypothetical protein